MLSLYNNFIYNPLFNLLVGLYNTVAFGDLGIAIILLTLLVRLLLYPIFQKSIRQQLAMQELQPEMEEIKIRHKNNREEQTKAIMGLFKERRVNPFSGFFLLFLQLPVLIALFQIFAHSFGTLDVSRLYPFITAPVSFNDSFLGLISLQGKSIVMVLLAALSTYAQGVLGSPSVKARSGPTASQQRTMLLVGPLMTFVVLNYFLPGAHNAVALYWIATSVFSIGQQYLTLRKSKKND